MRKPEAVLILFILAIAATAAPVAHARTPARCGLSAGAVAGPSIPREPELKDEFMYLYRIEGNAKYYFLRVFSISGDMGYEFGQGRPKHFFYRGEIRDLDGRGRSNWSALQTWGTLRLEPFRNFFLNPYVGGGAGYKYIALDRRGRERQISISDAAIEWLPGWMGLAGFDYILNDFFAFRLEGRYSSMTSKLYFLRRMDMGTYDVLAGINIYF